MKRIKQLALTGLLTIFALSINNKAFAHCEIPCGIYGDSLRIEQIREHIVTLDKSMKMIMELSKEETVNYNQLVRWINNKDDHANQLQDIVSQYFLHQRIKPVDPENKDMHEKYVKHLTLMHELLVYAMKAKQTTDLKYIDKLNETVTKFAKSYFHSHKH